MTVRLHNIIFNSVLAILLSALFVSCKDKEEEENTNKSQSKGGVIGFNAFQDGFQKLTTRAVIDKIDQLNEIYVLSMKKKDSGNWEQVFKNDAGAGIDVLTLTNSGNIIWDYSPVENWEDGCSYKFRAFYPKTFNTGAGESCTNGFEYSPLTSGSTTLILNNYKSATDPRNNTDLLASKEVTRAYTVAEKNDQEVALDMKHLLSCVNFNITNKKPTEKLTILGVKFKGYASEGSCEISSSINWTPSLDAEIKYEDEAVVDPHDFTFRHYNNNGELVEFNPTAPGQLKKGEYIVTLKKDDNWESPTFEGATIEIGGGVLINDAYQNLLFIPQKLDRGSKELKFVVNRNTLNFTIDYKVVAEIEFYFGNDSSKKLSATVDLTANGKVPEWEPGVKYNYTIGIYEYQATANITIEDWVHHTYEEELK